MSDSLQKVGFYLFPLVNEQNMKQCLSDLKLAFGDSLGESFCSKKYASVCKWFRRRPTKAFVKTLQRLLQKMNQPDKESSVERNNGCVRRAEESVSKVKPNTSQKNEAEDIPKKVKPNTSQKNEAEDIPKKVKPNTSQKNEAEDIPKKVKPNTSQKNKEDILNKVKPNTSQKNKEEDILNKVKPYTNQKNKEEDILNKVKPYTSQKNKAEDNLNKVKPNTSQKNTAGDSTNAVKPNTSRRKGTVAEDDIGQNMCAEKPIDKVNGSESQHIMAGESIIMVRPNADQEDGDKDSINERITSKTSSKQSLAKNEEGNGCRQKPSIKCSIHLGSCTIDEKNWSKMSMSGKLIPKIYCPFLTQCFFNIESDCVPYFDRYYTWKSTSEKDVKITVYAHCRHEKCRHYRLILSLEEGSLLPTLDVFTDFIEKCHKAHPLTRPVSGLHRQEMYEIAESMKPSSFKNKMVLGAEVGPLQRGNAQNITSNSVVRRVCHDARTRNIAHSDPVYAVMLLRRKQAMESDIRKKQANKSEITKKQAKGSEITKKQAIEPDNQYIWFVGDPLFVIIFCQRRLELFKEALKSVAGVGVILHLDATGSVVGKVCKADHRIYYYSIVFQFKDQIIPLTEFISSNHDARMISFWLDRFAYFAKNNGVARVGQFIVLDCSYAELNAVVRAFNGCRMYLFLQILYEFASGQAPEKWVNETRSSYVLPHLCYAHMMKLMGDTVKKFYFPSPSVQHGNKDCPDSNTLLKEEERVRKSKSGEKMSKVGIKVAAYKKQLTGSNKKFKLTVEEYKSVKGVLLDIFSLLAQTQKYSELCRLFYHFFVLLIFRDETAEVTATIENLTSLVLKFNASYVPPQSEDEREEKEKEDEGTENKEKEDIEKERRIYLDFSNPKVHYKTNPFYLDLEKVFAAVIDVHKSCQQRHQDSRLKKNLYFNPLFALHVLTQFAHIIPLWTGLLLPHARKISNAPVENWFNQVKNVFMGKETDCRVDRFIEKVNDRVIGMHKLLMNNVPKEGLTGRKRKSTKKNNGAKDDSDDNNDKPQRKKLKESSQCENSEAEDDPAEMIDLTELETLNIESPNTAYDLQAEEVWKKKGRFKGPRKRVYHSDFAHIKKLYPLEKLSSGDRDKKSVKEQNLPLISKKDDETLDLNHIQKVPDLNSMSNPCKPLITLEMANSATFEGLPLVTEKKNEQEISVMNSEENDCIIVATSSASLHSVGLEPSNVSSGKDYCSKTKQVEASINPTIKSRCPSSRHILSSLKGQNASFEKYISSCLQQNSLILDINYYMPVSNLHSAFQEDKIVNYRVSRLPMSSCSPAGWEITFEDFLTTCNVGPLVSEADAWLSGFIIHAVSKLFIQLYGVDEKRTLFIPADVGSNVFNNRLVDSYVIPSGIQFVIMPYSVGVSATSRGSHWCLVFVDLTNLKFYHFDPMRAVTRSSKQHLNNFLKFIHFSRSEISAEADWSFPPVSHPQQKDSYNCGVFVVYFIQSIMKTCASTFTISSSFNPLEYRKLLRFLLLSCSLNVLSGCLTCGCDRPDDEVHGTSWVACDVCKRWLHIDKKCLNCEEDYAQFLRINGAKVHYSCYLCSANRSSFTAQQKIEMLKEFQLIYDKYLVQ